MYDAVATHKRLMEALALAGQAISPQIAAQQAAMEAIEAPSFLDQKTKLLCCIATIAYTRCEDCVALHMPKLIAAGATRQEVLDAAAVALAFGGGPSMAFVATVIAPAYDQFAALTQRGGSLPADKHLFALDQ